jgi:perosamine synthetase
MIPVFKPSYGPEELEALREPFATGWIGLGPKTKEFEEKFAAYVGSRYAVGMNSATSALHLGLHLLNVAGDEVITTSMTFVSTNHVILYEQAAPVFADIEEDTLNINPAEIEKLITPRTRAIVCVHYGGHACDLDAIHAIAKAHHLPVLEDAAHACGTLYQGKPIGGLSDVTCFSFHAVKNLATGEGGMVTVNNPDWDARLRRTRWLGINKSTFDRSIVDNKYSWYYEVEELGFKYHMSDIAAALGIVQLAKLERANARRREIVRRYNEAFADLSGLRLPVEKPYTRSSCHNYVVRVRGGRRDAFVTHLADRGVATSVHYIPNHLYEMYRPYARPLPVTERVWKELVTLPLFPDLTESQLDQIITAVRSFKF